MEACRDAFQILDELVQDGLLEEAGQAGVALPAARDATGELLDDVVGEALAAEDARDGQRWVAGSVGALKHCSRMRCAKLRQKRSR
eukprot:10517269-Alexandrium_andersonii.AAC.1